jgi:hypothetical protein
MASKTQHDRPSDRIAITVDLTSVDAWALAQMTKRFTFEHAASLSVRHDGGRERDAMLSGICALQRALADAGFGPR